MKNHTAIVFHKDSSWKIEFLDSKGTVIDHYKRNDRREAIIQKIKLFIEKAYPHYAKSNFANHITATLMSGFSNVCHDKRLRLKLLSEYKHEIISEFDALEIVFKAPLNESDIDHCWVG